MAIDEFSNQPRALWRDLLVFFPLAYGISWLLWGAIIGLHLSAAPGKSITGRILYFAGIQGPCLAAVIISCFRGGSTQVKRFFARIVHRPFNPIWIIVAFAAFPAIYLGAMLIAVLRHQVDLPHPLVVTPAMGWFGLLWGQSLIMFGEEYGWRGFALPRMEKLLGTLGASVLLGILWAFWHTLLFFTSGSWQSGSLTVYVAATVASTIVQAAIFFRTNRSVLAAMLYHGALNASQFTLDVPARTTTYLPWMWGVALLIAILLMPRPWFNWRTNARVQ